MVGAGHSAATSLLALADLQQQAPGTEVVWAVRSATPRPLVGKGSAEADELPARGRLATDLAALVEDGRIELVSGFRIHTVGPVGDRVGWPASASRATTSSRPRTSLWRLMK